MHPNKPIHDMRHLETFSDAVFAFAATLLVVSLEVPRSFHQLVGELRGFAAFGLSFAALVIIWSVRNAFFRKYGIQDRMTIFLNSCLLFVVLFYVYPLKFITGGIAGSLLRLQGNEFRVENLGELSALFILYSLGFVAVFLCVAFLYLHVWRIRQALELDEIAASDALFHFRHYMILVFVGILSILLAWMKAGIRYGIPGFAYVLVGPLCYLHALAYKRKKR